MFCLVQLPILCITLLGGRVAGYVSSTVIANKSAIMMGRLTHYTHHPFITPSSFFLRHHRPCRPRINYHLVDLSKNQQWKSSTVGRFVITRLFAVNGVNGSGPFVRGGSINAQSECTQCSQKSQKIIRISYITDIEGDAEYLKRFVNLSKVLHFKPSKPNDSLTHDHYDHLIDFSAHDDDAIVTTMLVFGGDVCDKGGSDLYVLRQLLSLVRRYNSDKDPLDPNNRVHLIMGNRDVNKLRIFDELVGCPQTPNLQPLSEKAKVISLGLNTTNENLRKTTTTAARIELPPHEGLYWLRDTGRVGDPELYERDQTRRVPSDSAGDRLKWMLRNTMGSPDAFVFRREELSRDNNVPLRSITDDHVAQSYIDTCAPKSNNQDDNLMIQYLLNASPIKRIGNALFLHGALPRNPTSTPSNSSNRNGFDYSYALPWRVETTSFETSPIQVLEEINLFAIDQMKRFCSSNYTIPKSSTPWCTVGGYHETSAHPGGPLMQYGMSSLPDRTKNPTVIYNSWLSDSMPEFIYNPELATQKHLLQDFLYQTQIQMIVTGHKPHGDSPLPIKILSSNNQPCWIVTGDTSYSGDTVWVNDCRNNLGRGNAKSGRGDVAVRYVNNNYKFFGP